MAVYSAGHNSHVLEWQQPQLPHSFPPFSKNTWNTQEWYPHSKQWSSWNSATMPDINTWFLCFWSNYYWYSAIPANSASTYLSFLLPFLSNDLHLSWALLGTSNPSVGFNLGLPPLYRYCKELVCLASSICSFLSLLAGNWEQNNGFQCRVLSLISASFEYFW